MKVVPPLNGPLVTRCPLRPNKSKFHKGKPPCLQFDMFGDFSVWRPKKKNMKNERNHKSENQKIEENENGTTREKKKKRKNDQKKQNKKQNKI